MRYLEQANAQRQKEKQNRDHQGVEEEGNESYYLTNSYKTNKNTFFLFPTHCLLITPLSELLKGFVSFVWWWVKGLGWVIVSWCFLAVPSGLWRILIP